MLNVRLLDCALPRHEAVAALLELDSDGHFVNEEALCLVTVLRVRVCLQVSSVFLALDMALLQTVTRQTPLLVARVGHRLLPHAASAALDAHQRVTAVPLLCLWLLNGQQLFITVSIFLCRVAGGRVARSDHDRLEVLERT